MILLFFSLFSLKEKDINNRIYGNYNSSLHNKKIEIVDTELHHNV